MGSPIWTLSFEKDEKNFSVFNPLKTSETVRNFLRKQLPQCVLPALPSRLAVLRIHTSKVYLLQGKILYNQRVLSIRRDETCWNSPMFHQIPSIFHDIPWYHNSNTIIYIYTYISYIYTYHIYIYILYIYIYTDHIHIYIYIYYVYV